VIRVLLAEDMHVVRTALAALIDLEPDLTVVASVGRGDEVLAAVDATHPDVAVLDVEMPGADGVSVAKSLRERAPGVKIMILTALGRPGTVRGAMQAGATGFVLKNAPAAQLIDGIRAVAEGRMVLQPELAAAAMQFGSSPLTPRESDVLERVADGSSVRDVAETLFLSEGTVRNYLTAILDKLGARSRVDAVRIAQTNGWI